MNAVLKQPALGRSSRDPRYACVLTLIIGNADGELDCGHAVLIAPDLALTAAHCVKQWQRRLRVRSALGGRAVDVAAVHWPSGSHYRYGDTVQQFPHFSLDRYSDDIVVLQLATPLASVCAALPFVPPDAPYPVELARAGNRRSVNRLPLRVAAELRGLAVAVDPDDSEPPAVSGAPAFYDPGDGTALRLAGLQVCVGCVPEGVPPPLSSRYAGLVPLTPTRLAWIRALRRGNDDEADATAPATAPAVATASARRFVIRRADGSLHSGEDTLIEIDDLDYFHLMPWRLLASGTLELLTSEGALWTTRVAQGDQIRLQIVTHPQREVIELLLRPGGSDGAPWPWLAGSVWYEQQWVHVYLYRRSDGPEQGPCCNAGRVRIEAFIDGGAHDADRPEAHERVYDDGSLVAGAPPPPLRWRKPAPALAQDEVGNGYEGHKVR